MHSIVSGNQIFKLSELDKILNLKVSFQENTWTMVSNTEPLIQNVLDIIRSDKFKNQVTALRTNLENGNLDFYNNHKKRLPAVTFSATFNKTRTRENLKKYNSLVVLDIDKLNEEEIKICHNKLQQEEVVIAFWRSPSNKGYKGLVNLEFSQISEEIDLDTKHKSAFNKLSDYFKEKHDLVLDNSGSDISRLCFLSYDPQLVLKKHFEKFVVTDNDIESFTPKRNTGKTRKIKFANNKDALFNPFERNNQFDRKLMSDIIRHLTKKSLSITFSYSDWCKVAMSIANTFTYDIGIKYFIKLSKLDGNKFDEFECENFLSNCYETRNGEINFSSIIHLANKKGYKTKHQKNKGAVTKVEV